MSDVGVGVSSSSSLSLARRDAAQTDEAVSPIGDKALPITTERAASAQVHEATCAIAQATSTIVDAVPVETEWAARELSPMGDTRARGLVDAAALARVLDVSRGYVYAHADELGAVRLGSGPRPRLRFDVERSLERLTSLAGKGSPPAETASVRGSRSSLRRATGRVPNGVPTVRLVARGSRA